MDLSKLPDILATNYYAIPDYQRDYEWKDGENTTLFEDIMSLVDDPTIQSHFIGVFVTVKYDKSVSARKCIDFDQFGINEANVKHLLDGQQRITSLFIFMSVLHEAIKNDQIMTPSKRQGASNQLYNFMHGNNFDNNLQQAPRLILNGNTGRCFYSEIMNQPIAGTINHTLMGAKRIKKAFSLYSKGLADAFDDYKENHPTSENVADDFYLKILDVLRNKLTVVEICCGEGTNAFQVFDSLNGKGMDLTAADRIKSIFMSWAPSGKASLKWDAALGSLEESAWTSFFSSVLFYKCAKRISKVNLPDEFRKQFAKDATGNFDAFFSEIQISASIYSQLRQAKTGIQAIDEALLDFSCLGIEQVYTILFAVAFHYRDQNIIRTKDFTEFVEKLTSLVVRMQVAGKNTNKYDNYFSTLITEMLDANKNTTIVNLNKKLSTFVSEYTDESFITAFAEFAPSSSSISEFYLRHLENHYRKKVGDRNPIKHGLTVEHIIPQTLANFEDWYGPNPDIPENLKESFKESVVEHIGNKALLFDDDNSSASNNSFDKKLKVYINGKEGQTEGFPVDTFQLIKDVVATYKDTGFYHKQVFERAKKLALAAVEIWK